MGMSPRPVPLLACPAVLSASGAIWVFMHVVDGGQRGLGGRQIAGVVGVFVRTNLTCRARLDEVSGWHSVRRVDIRRHGALLGKVNSGTRRPSIQLTSLCNCRFHPNLIVAVHFANLRLKAFDTIRRNVSFADAQDL